MSLLKEDSVLAWVEVRSCNGTDTIIFEMLAFGLVVDGSLVTVNPKELEDLAKELGAVAPTPYLLDLKAHQSTLWVDPQPKYYHGGVGMSSSVAEKEHTCRVLKAAGFQKLEELQESISNFGKHWVYPLEKEELYGWHVKTCSSNWKGIPLYPSVGRFHNLRVIQQRSGAHSGSDDQVVEGTHRDYSMTVQLVNEICLVNGIKRKTEEIYKDARFIPLVWGSELPRFVFSNPEDFPTLKKGAKGPWVEKLQTRLIHFGLSLSPYGADGSFGPITEAAVKDFWKRISGKAKTSVDNEFWVCLMSEDPKLFVPSKRNEPPIAPFRQINNAERQELFGRIEFEPRSEGRIRITNDFLKREIVRIQIPQLNNPKIKNHPEEGFIWVNRACVKQFFSLFEELENSDLLKHILTWNGLGNPRLIRGRTNPVLSNLSSHSWFTAFDINYRWNVYGAEPADFGEEGTTLPLVEVAYKHGFGWGGCFGKKDGGHFSVWKVI